MQTGVYVSTEVNWEVGNLRSMVLLHCSVLHDYSLDEFDTRTVLCPTDNKQEAGVSLPPACMSHLAFKHNLNHSINRIW